MHKQEYNGWIVQEAQQLVRFRLDRRERCSNRNPKPGGLQRRAVRAGRPGFQPAVPLILMQRSGAATPYFALWVDNGRVARALAPRLAVSMERKRTLALTRPSPTPPPAALRRGLTAGSRRSEAKRKERETLVIATETFVERGNFPAQELVLPLPGERAGVRASPRHRLHWSG